MDVRSLMNDGPAEEQKRPPPVQRASTNQGLTPLHTLSQGAGAAAGAAAGGGQYSFRYPPPHPPPPPYPQQQYPHSAHPSSSLSPTPSARRSPHSVRHSPMSAMSAVSHAPPPQHSHPHPQHPYHQPSQPSTPLAPPPLHHQRSSSSYFPDPASPFHARNYSATSNGPVSASPLQPSPGHAHRSSDAYLPSSDVRERSLSVSPKTKVPPRPPSMGGSSRHSSHSASHYEAYRPAMVGSPPEHVMQPFMAPPQQQPGVTPISAAQFPAPLPPNANSQVAQQHALAQTQMQSAPVPNLPLLNSNTPLAGSYPQIRNQHHSQKMEMSHLLTPTTEMPPALSVAKSRASAESKPDLKRPADSELSAEQPAYKLVKTRKYSQRPIWAQLSNHNPKFSQQGSAAAPSHSRQTLQPNGAPSQQANGQPTSNGDSRPPWQQNPPLDHDLIHARSLLGKWEKSFRWITPYPDMQRVVSDWLFTELDKLRDVGVDPREGTVEIEAKIGTLLRDGQRVNLPVMTATVVNPQHAEREYHFESQMTLIEHKTMNEFLNLATRESHAKGRVTIDYKHLHERDSFHTLSAYGQQVLPAALQRRTKAREPRLRITRDISKEGKNAILAKIVKLPITNLHIYNPLAPYDCRISINLEVNLDRPDLDLAALIADPSETTASGKPVTKDVDRVKDRLSYKHLAYSIDLTKVLREGLNPSFELELELDSSALRAQMRLMQEQRENAFADVVAGFVDNAMFLMQCRPEL